MCGTVKKYLYGNPVCVEETPCTVPDSLGFHLLHCQISVVLVEPQFSRLEKHDELLSKGG